MFELETPQLQAPLLGLCRKLNLMMPLRHGICIIIIPPSQHLQSTAVLSKVNLYIWHLRVIIFSTDYGHTERKQSSLHGREFNPNPKCFGTAKAYFVCHIGPIFQISLIFALIGCPQSVIFSKAKEQSQSKSQSPSPLFTFFLSRSSKCYISGDG